MEVILYQSWQELEEKVGMVGMIVYGDVILYQNCRFIKKKLVNVRILSHKRPCCSCSIILDSVEPMVLKYTV